MTDNDTCVGPALVECSVCAAIGLPEQIHERDCDAFRARK